MGGSAKLTAFVKDNPIAKLRKRQGVPIVHAFIANTPAGLAICFEGFSTVACKPQLNIHDIFPTDFMLWQKKLGGSLARVGHRIAI